MGKESCHVKSLPAGYKCAQSQVKGTCFSKAPQMFCACKGIFSQSVSKIREVHTPETSCMEGTSVHIRNMLIIKLCNHKV